MAENLDSNRDDASVDNRILLRRVYKTKIFWYTIVFVACALIGFFILRLAEASPNWSSAVVYFLFAVFIASLVTLVFSGIMLFISVIYFTITSCVRETPQTTIHKTRYKGHGVLGVPDSVKPDDELEWFWLFPGIIKMYLDRDTRRAV